HFLRLRLDAHAQLEIRRFAAVMAGMVKKVAPIAWAAFEDYSLYSVSFSLPELELLGWAMNSNIVLDKESWSNDYLRVLGIDMSKREIDEFFVKLQFVRSKPTKVD